MPNPLRQQLLILLGVRMEALTMTTFYAEEVLLGTYPTELLHQTPYIWRSNKKRIMLLDPPKIENI